MDTLCSQAQIYRFSSNIPFFVDYPLSGAKCLHQSPLYNLAPKKVISNENQYNKRKTACNGVRNADLGISQ
jgi:hypothetical protein